MKASFINFAKHGFI